MTYLIYLCLSAIVSFIFIFSVEKYKVELISKVVPIENFSYCYADLDNDGNSEKIVYVKKYHDILGLIISSGGKILEGQWNFSGEWATTWSPFFVDYDKDGVKEIFVFTVRNDSIFMHCLDAINKKIEIENKAVCHVFKENGEYDFKIRPCGAYDVDADDYKELFFSIETDYSTRPRNMFAYYPKKDSILVSPESCSLILFPEMFDIDGDSIPEFITSLTYATGNCQPESKFTDQFSWLMVFTPEMEFKFPPTQFYAHPAISKFIPFNTGAKSNIFAMHFYEGSGKYPDFMALIDINGKIIRKKIIERDESWYYSRLFSRDDDHKDVFILQKDGAIMKIDSTLSLQYVAEFENISNSVHVQKMDIDCDGINEFIFPGKDKKEIIIYRNDFSNPSTFEFNENIINFQMSIIQKVGYLPKVFVDTNEYLYTFSYDTTLLYQYRYAIFIPIFLAFIFFHFVIKKIRKYKKLKIESTQKHILSLQLKSIQNQFDPHFTFNIFASFANLITEKDTEQANFILSKYAGLLRASVINSEKIHLCLQEELDFVERYLELERFMYSNKFSFQINICENIDTQILIPKMLMHIFVENSIKHGLKHLDVGGELLINGTQNNGEVYLSIKDNGVGRVKAKEYGSFSTGKGLGIINQILEHYYLLNKIRITYKIIDLYENNIAAGTEVKICIPL